MLPAYTLTSLVFMVTALSVLPVDGMYIYQYYVQPQRQSSYQCTDYSYNYNTPCPIETCRVPQTWDRCCLKIINYIGRYYQVCMCIPGTTLTNSQPVVVPPTTTSTNAGNATAVNPAPGNATAGNATAGNATAGNATAGNTTAGNATAGNATAGNTTAGNATAGNATAGNTTAGNTTAGNATAGNATAGNTAAENTTSGNATAGNTTAGNATAGNTTAGNTTAGNTTAGSTTAGNTTAGNTTAGNTTAGNATAANATSLCPNTFRILNAKPIDQCAFKGVANLTRTIGQIQVVFCNAVYTPATVNGVQKFTFVIPNYCASIINGSTDDVKEISIGDAVLPIKTLMTLVPGPNGLTFMDINPRYRNTLASLGCQKPACTYNGGNEMAGKIDFNNCKMVSWGATNSSSMRDFYLTERKFALAPFGCKNNTLIPTDTETFCFKTVDSSNAFCFADTGAGMYCFAQSTNEWILLGSVARSVCNSDPYVSVMLIP